MAFQQHQFTCRECKARYTVSCMSEVANVCKPCHEEASAVDLTVDSDPKLAIEAIAGQFGMRVLFSDDWHQEGTLDENAR